MPSGFQWIIDSAQWPRQTDDGQAEFDNWILMDARLGLGHRPAFNEKWISMVDQLHRQMNDGQAKFDDDSG